MALSENFPKEQKFNSQIDQEEFFIPLELNLINTGAGYFISKDIVSLLLLNRSKVDKNLWDDVAVGKNMEDKAQIKELNDVKKDAERASRS